jgi:uncharacterized protein (DUF2235 family)
MGTKIILLSDGTGNAASKVWRTNVWRVFESLDLTGSDQVGNYDDGVGTSSFKPLALLGGAFGWGLKRNVLDLYKFVCRNYRSNEDEIFGFGFSRGAFTIRIVVGLMFDQGLVPADGGEEELHRRARDAYREFRRKNFHTVWHIEEPFRFVRDLLIPNSYDPSKNRRLEKIRFLGLWDTVAAYGLPVDEMTRGVSQWIWPLELPERRLCDQVERACHALSLDDERTTFHPVLWTERHEPPPACDADGIHETKNQRISQVWFSGVHANVGGGYPDDSLAHIPLCWIMAEAQECGLRYKTSPPADPDAMAYRKAGRDKDGRLYDSRHGLAGYYRYGPRKIYDLCHMRFSRRPDDEIEIAVPKIHESALKRIRTEAHPYAPIGLPAEYAVVTEGRRVLPLALSPYESPLHAQARAKAQERVWNLVWCRRVVYFATVFASLYLALYPLAEALPRSDEFSTTLRPLSDLIRLLGSFLPGTLEPWLNAYARGPGHFLAAVAAVALLMVLGSAIGAKITEEMRSIWKSTAPVERRGLLDRLIYGLRTSAQYQFVLWATKRHVAPFVFAVLFVCLGLTFASHLLFNIQDAAGWVCREKQVDYASDARHPSRIKVKDYKGLANLGAGETHVLAEFKTNELCQSTGVWVERNGKYLITFASTDSFRDGKIDASEGYYSTTPTIIVSSSADGSQVSTRPAPLWQRVALVVGIPLRRELIRPWFRVVARIGGKGSEESFLDPDFTDKYLINEEIRAPRDGELFLFVNDAAIGIPGLYDLFYGNNEGSTRVTIKRL